MATASSLDDIPPAVLTAMICYLDDPQSICALENSSHSFRSLVMGSGCWASLHRHRWNAANNNNAIKRRSQWQDADYKRDYKRRHQLDAQIQRRIDTLLIETTEREEVVRAVTDVMSYGRDSLDVCWKSWQSHRTGDDNDGEATTYIQRNGMITLCLLRSVHCAAVFEDIKDLGTGDPSFLLGVDEDSDDSPALILEEYAIASSRMFFDIKGGPNDATSAWIKQQLDDMAKQVQEGWKAAETQQLQSTVSSSSSLSAESKLDILNTVFFEELNFTGNTDNYYHFDNSMIHTCLKRRIGIPMTLAILYKCVSRRIGLHVDIIGLPGHIVIGVPSLDRYIDVFRRGRVLSMADCERLVNSIGHPMVPEFLQPLTPSQVFQRILNNCTNCLSQIFPPNVSKRMAIEAMRAILINPTQTQVEDCRRWFSSVLWGSHSTAHLQGMSKW
jgi:regulator of sirC expression with transglutaminase-like and TPR domain